MALASCASVVLGGGAATAAEPGEWTQYRQTSTNNTHVASGVAELFEGSIATDDEARATPVIADGKMFVGSHNSGALQAFDLSSGAELWKAKAPNWIHSEMIYSGGRIFVGFGNRFFDPAGHRGTGESGVMALDAETGNVLWTFPTVGEVMPTPVVVNGAVYAVTGGRHLFRIDPATGEELDSTDLGHIVSMSSPAEHDGKLYFGSGSPAPYTFFSYDTSTDTVAWSKAFPEFNRGLDDVPPAVDDGIVVTTGNATILPGLDGPRERHTIVAMDEATGEVRWRRSLGDGPEPNDNRSGTPTIADGTVYVGSPTTSAAYAFDLRTGEQRWRNPIGAIKGAPVVSGTDAYFATTAGDVYRLDTRTGAITGKLALEGALAPAGPIIVDDTLVVPSQSKHVYFTPLDEFPDFAAPAGPGVGSTVDPLGSTETLSGSLGLDAGSLDPAY